MCSSACSKDYRQNMKEPLFTGMGEPWGLPWSPQTSSSSSSSGSISGELVKRAESQTHPRSALGSLDLCR